MAHGGFCALSRIQSHCHCAVLMNRSCTLSSSRILRQALWPGLYMVLSGDSRLSQGLGMGQH